MMTSSLRSVSKCCRSKCLAGSLRQQRTPSCRNHSVLAPQQQVATRSAQCQQQNLLHAQRQWHAHRSSSSAAATNSNSDPLILSLPRRYLRAMEASNFDATTQQRANVHYDTTTGKPLPGPQVPKEAFEIVHCEYLASEHNVGAGVYRITWGDGHMSEYSHDWVQREVNRCHGTSLTSSDRPCIQPWTNWTEEHVRTNVAVSFEQAVLTDEGMHRTLKALYQYGIALVTDTPTEDQGVGVAALAASVGGGSVKTDNPTSYLDVYRKIKSTSQQQQLDVANPIYQLAHGTDGPLRTLYGTVWSTTSSGQAQGASVADSAYGSDGLPLHTDMTYHRDPPGLQIFTMKQPAAKGGESVFGDGFAVAERLREKHPNAFDLLTRTVRRYRCMDSETGWHLEAHGPVIQLRGPQIVGIRHNDLDRMPDFPPPAEDGEGELFYQQLVDAHQKWDELLARDEFRLVMALKPGETMVVANHRCFHGRFSFQTTADMPRSVIGCYISQDELTSRFRQEGFEVS